MLIATRDFMPAKMREAMPDTRQVDQNNVWVLKRISVGCSLYIHAFSIQAFLTKIFALFFGAVTFGVTFVIRFSKYLKDC